MSTRSPSTSLTRRSFAAGVVFTPLLAGPTGQVTAQEATPAPMSVEETVQILNNYLTALLGGGDFGQYMAEDVVVSFMDADQQVSGRQAAIDGLIALHTVQFDAQPELVNMVAGEGVAAVEALFIGTHTDEFAEIPATGTVVSIPYIVMSSLADGLIVELRIYGLVSGLMQQISGGAAATPAA